jgi:hypothetical protein
MNGWSPEGNSSSGASSALIIRVGFQSAETGNLAAIFRPVSRAMPSAFSIRNAATQGRKDHPQGINIRRESMSIHRHFRSQAG